MQLRRTTAASPFGVFFTKSNSSLLRSYLTPIYIRAHPVNLSKYRIYSFSPFPLPWRNQNLKSKSIPRFLFQICSINLPMATPDREAIDTYVSITGSSEEVAVQKIQVKFLIFVPDLDICVVSASILGFGRILWFVRFFLASACLGFHRWTWIVDVACGKHESF